MSCDYRHPACVNDGVMVGGRWVCRQHLAAPHMAQEGPLRSPHFTARPLADLALLAWTLRRLHQDKRHAGQHDSNCTPCQLFAALVTERTEAP